MSPCNNNLAFWKVSSSPKLSRWVQLEVVRPKVFGFCSNIFDVYDLKWDSTKLSNISGEDCRTAWPLRESWQWCGFEVTTNCHASLLKRSFESSEKNHQLQFTWVWWWSPWILWVSLGFLICRDTCHLSQIVQILRPQFGEYVTVGGERQIDGN